jgi:glycosyltransferase involved in cell wall biosynthesis
MGRRERGRRRAVAQDGTRAPVVDVAVAPRVGMALIVRDAAETIERCLASFWPHVDRVGILDTGSTDGTLAIVEAFAADRPGAKLVTGSFEWRDDFAAARAAADALLEDCEWLSWIDADDELRGAELLRALAARAPAELAGWVAAYDYGISPAGERLSSLAERLVRAGAGPWIGRVHETRDVAGPLTMAPARLRWVHRRPLSSGDASIRRNLRILRAWVRDEPGNSRVLRLLGREELAAGRPERAVPWYRRYLELQPIWNPERGQVAGEFARTLAALGEVDEAVGLALEAISYRPTDAEGHEALAEILAATGDPGDGIR